MTKKKDSNIKVIAFDLGGVLVADDTNLLEKRYHYEKLARYKQLKYRSTLEQGILGKVPTSELLRTIQDTLAPEASVKELKDQLFYLQVIQPNWRLAQNLKKHYRVVILTNTQYNWPSAVARRTGIKLNQFMIINSARIKLKKPDRDYFEYAFRRLRVKPEQMVFIDDRLPNIQAAKKLGMHAFHYQSNHSKLIKFLRNLNVKGL